MKRNRLILSLVFFSPKISTLCWQQRSWLPSSSPSRLAIGSTKSRSFRDPSPRFLAVASSRLRSHRPIGRGIFSLASHVRRRRRSTENSTATLDVDVQELKEENDRLREELSRLEAENERLHQDSLSSRIVLETFEGESKLRRPIEEGSGAMEDVRLPSTAEDMLANNDTALWCDDLEDGVCPVEPTVSFGEALRDRAYWLVGLLVLQSCSGFILARNEALLADHPVIIYFLTMLVGAGGNAGNQASVRVIRGLALGTLNERTQVQFLTRELKMAASLSFILSTAGFIRATAFRTPFPEAVAVTTALAMIVFSSICLGAVLPLVLKRFGVDPAHSSTTIQVVMDILGVLLAVCVSSLLLDSPLGGMLVRQLSGSPGA